MHLAKASEKILSFPSHKDAKENEEVEKKGARKSMKWALPGLQPKAFEIEASSSFSPSDQFFTTEKFGSDSKVSSSLDSSQGRTSEEVGGRRSRGKQNERGRSKEEEFLKKVQEMIMEEERQRIPIAQGLPWTTDEPECLVKPLVKESTNPIDLWLYSDLRAVECAEFDHHLAEEEEIRRLRKELVPKAQPMLCFDKPFIPKSGDLGRANGKNGTDPTDWKTTLEDLDGAQNSDG
ncbi:hypothetical protein NE237_027451 [Protea cynaroides]|uniref:TPX2 C-terminal domain-containing protein n=1 Tax=Protea cynaroides TaxID=273540 RepID=A0A9Q0GRW9_9MAGN|nr:hypothetical protein NE237_027451 [Protea cynaroides]